MSEQTIYDALRAGGLSPAGACAMMGNMFCESALKSNNVQDNCTLGDFNYTNAVDSGTITRWQFMADSFGYGLCQWTYPGRKDRLYMYAREKGVSVSNEQMQCEFCLAELRTDYAELFGYLCATEDLPKATERICAEFERPAVNNFADRINAAQKYYNQMTGGSSGCSGDSCAIDITADQITTVAMRILKRGDLGRDVFLYQCGLIDMGFDCGVPDGDFGLNTEEATRELQRAKEIEPNGVADQRTLNIVFSRK